MDKFEKFLRSEMSVRRLCELAEGEGLGLMPILQKPPRQPTDRPFGRKTRQRLVHGILPTEIEKINWAKDRTPPAAVNTAYQLGINGLHSIMVPIPVRKTTHFI